MIGAPFGIQHGLMLSLLGVPFTRPPRSAISAVDLDTGLAVAPAGCAEPGKLPCTGKRPDFHSREA
jgi:glucose dehydrogenase